MAGLTVTRTWVGTTPATVFAPASGERAPVVVIAHGFAGSQQLMQPFAVTLARNGYVAVTFDFPGHGRNPEPLAGGLADDAVRGRVLLDALDHVVAFARGLPQSDGRLALLGHSMASDIVVRYAEAHPEAVQATVAVSLFSPGVTATSPRNLLVVDGALEPAMLTDEGFRIAAQASGAPPAERTTYGSFGDGTARRVVLARGVEHIGVLYSRDSLAESLAWLDATFGRRGDGFVDARGPWLGLLFLGLVALARPLARLLPRATIWPRGAGLPWRRLLPAALGPAVLTPLILWRLPTDFLPVLLGDYLAAHLAVYGLLTGLCLWLFRHPAAAPGAPVSRPALALATLALSAYILVALGLPVDRFVTSFVPADGRLPLVLAVLAGTLPYALADEWLTRGPAAPRGGYAVTKLGLVVSLALAVALNPARLFFLAIIVPAVLVLLTVFGLVSGWAYRRVGHPLPGAVANALALAWAIAVTFPVVAR